MRVSVWLLSECAVLRVFGVVVSPYLAYLALVVSCGLAVTGLALLSIVETFQLHLDPSERRRV